MAYIEWSKDLDTGIEAIDGQHRQIIDYINRLQDAIELGSRERMATIFDDLVDYTVTHFSFEEGLQERAGYEYYAGHKRVHQLFIKKLAEYRTKFEAGDPQVAEQVAEMLRNWLVNHIQTEDADYVPAVSKIVVNEEKRGWLAGRLKKLFGGS
jgi:hemerythrin